MGYNKIPLALKFNDDTGNAEGLIEFQLNVSDIGDICEDDYNPQTGDVLTYNPALDCWTASAPPAVAAGALSALTDVCADVTSVTQYQALVWNGTEWCPSTIPTGGGGGGGVTSVNGDTGPDVGLYFSSLSGTNITDPGGDDAETDGKLPQIIEWTPGTDPNTGEWTNTYNDSVYIEVYNNTTATLAKGTAVYIEGVQGAETPRVEPAQANAAGTMPCVGVIYEPIVSNERGLLVSFGTAGGLNWDSTPVAGDIGKTVYVSPDNPGNLTLTKPTTTTSDLIQNVGILVKEGTTSSKIKVTGVGRSNDIPNDLDVVGSVTVGDTVISQTDAKLANVDADHILISTATSATSSIASATLFDQGITDQGIVTDDRVNVDDNDLLFKTGGSITGRTLDELDISTKTLLSTTSGNLLETPTGGANGNILFQSTGNATTSQTVSNFISTNSIATTPIADGDLASTFIKTDASTVNPPNLSGTITNGQLIKRSSDIQFAGVTTTDNSETFLGTNANLEDVTNVGVTATPANGDLLQYDGINWEPKTLADIQTDSDITGRLDLGTLGDVNDSDNPPLDISEAQTLLYDRSTSSYVVSALKHSTLSGLGDDDHTQYVLADGTRVVSGTLSALDFSATSGSVASTPTAANHIANKSYVDSQVPTPSYFQALASGAFTLSSNATEYDLGWSTSGTYAITDPAGNLEVESGDSQGHNINVSGDGVYQIDCSVQTTNTTNGGRVGAIIRIYRDIGDGDGFAEISELRASNYASRGIENIVTGTTHLNTLISLNAGDKLKFTIMRNTYTGTPNVTSNGTYLRIIKIA